MLSLFRYPIDPHGKEINRIQEEGNRIQEILRANALGNCRQAAWYR